MRILKNRIPPQRKKRAFKSSSNSPYLTQKNSTVLDSIQIQLGSTQHNPLWFGLFVCLFVCLFVFFFVFLFYFILFFFHPRRPMSLSVKCGEGLRRVLENKNEGLTSSIVRRLTRLLNLKKKLSEEEEDLLISVPLFPSSPLVGSLLAFLPSLPTLQLQHRRYEQPQRLARLDQMAFHIVSKLLRVAATSPEDSEKIIPGILDFLATFADLINDTSCLIYLSLNPSPKIPLISHYLASNSVALTVLPSLFGSLKAIAHSSFLWKDSWCHGKIRYLPTKEVTKVNSFPFKTYATVFVICYPMSFFLQSINISITWTRNQLRSLSEKSVFCSTVLYLLLFPHLLSKC